MSGLDDTLNHAADWYPQMPPPHSFSRLDAIEFQKRIDTIAGTRNEKPLIKLAWAPDELRWRPHKMGEEPPGYTFPIFIYGWDENRNEIAAPRWVLLQRAEPQHYAGTWEASRFSVYKGDVWDWRGPCPPERYTELRCHSYHDGECCPCHGDTCECGQEYDHCWGKYLDPSESLLDWVRWTVRESLNDPDVKPNEDVRYFTAPNAQRDLVTRQQHAEEKRVIEMEEFNRQLANFWATKPTSIGLKRSESGLYLLN